VTLDAEGHEASARCPTYSSIPTKIRSCAGSAHHRRITPSLLPGECRGRFLRRSAVFHQPWPLVSAAEKGQWGRGQQVGAIHRLWANCSCPCTAAAKARTRGGNGDLGIRHENPSTCGALARIHAEAWPVISGPKFQDDAPILFAATDRSDVAVSKLLPGICATSRSGWDRPLAYAHP